LLPLFVKIEKKNTSSTKVIHSAVSAELIKQNINGWAIKHRPIEI